MAEEFYQYAFEQMRQELAPRAMYFRATGTLFEYVVPAIYAGLIWIGSIVVGLLLYKLMMVPIYGCTRKYGKSGKHKNNAWKLVALGLEIVIIVGGTIIALQVVGLGFGSLVSIGAVSLIFTYSAMPVLTNVSSAFYIYVSGNFYEGEFMKVAHVEGQIMDIAKMVTVIYGDAVYNGEKRKGWHFVPNAIFQQQIYSVFEAPGGEETPVQINRRVRRVRGRRMIA